MARTLRIHWQHPVCPPGRLCPRCSAVGDEVDKAVAILERALPPLGIEPVLMITEIDTSTTRSNPAEGNRITIAGRTIDEWLGGSAGTARCSVCGAVDCLAPVVGGFQVEAIPARLLLRAALLASAALLDADPAHD